MKDARELGFIGCFEERSEIWTRFQAAGQQITTLDQGLGGLSLNVQRGSPSGHVHQSVQRGRVFPGRTP